MVDQKKRLAQDQAPHFRYGFYPFTGCRGRHLVHCFQTGWRGGKRTHPTNAKPDGATDRTTWFWYIADQTRLFAACGEDEKNRIVDALFREQFFPASTPAPELSAPAYVFPITLNAKWSTWPDIPVSEGTMYIWFVDKELEQVSTYAGTFKNCYTITLRTRPDVTIRKVRKGVGLVSWFYRHFGSTQDYIGILSSYQPSGTP